jgi:hypothetical protein
MFEQDQQVGNGAVAIQAKGDVTITYGMTPDQMTQIMVGLAKQLALYQSDAEAKVEERLAHFRKEILQEFADPERASTEAFRDPDFQYLLRPRLKRSVWRPERL